MLNRSFDFWPFLISLDLVRASASETATAVETEIARIVEPEDIRVSTFQLKNLTNVFRDPGKYASFPTIVYVIPTSTEWTVLWNNSFHCAGYDSLCHCLTDHHGLETFHFSSTDKDAFFQAGSNFTHRLAEAGTVIERTVQAAKNDSRWHWFDIGPRQWYEKTEHYAARSIRNRLNETLITEYLTKLGCDPRNTTYYDPGSSATRLERVNPPSSILLKEYSYVLQRCT